MESTGLAAPSSAGPTAQLLVFGDSLSDVGNAYAQRGSEAFACPPHWQGRRCDGPLWVELLAAALAMPAPLHSLAGGHDHAFGGARSGRGLSAKGMANLLEQVERYAANQALAASGAGRGLAAHGQATAGDLPHGLASSTGPAPVAGPGPTAGLTPTSGLTAARDPREAPAAAAPIPERRHRDGSPGTPKAAPSATPAALDPASTLVVLRAGANDYLDAPPGPAVAAAVNANLLAAVERLAELGFRRFLVPTELPWGLAPIERPGVRDSDRVALNALISHQNRALGDSLAELAAERALRVAQPDFGELLRVVCADPASHGFRNGRTPRLRDGDLTGCRTVPDADGHLWWDGWGHLSSAFHALLAERARASLVA